MAMMTKCIEGDGTHKLETKNYRRPYICYGCKEPGSGLRYRCDQCSHEFHEACTVIDVTRPITHEFFPFSEFHFQPPPPKVPSLLHRIYCNACKNEAKGFVFRCEEHNLDLHPSCSKLANTYQIEDMEFNLSKKAKGKCMRCKHRYGWKMNGWWYVSVCGKYRVHVDCVTQMALDEWNNNNSNTARNSRPFQCQNNGSRACKIGKLVLKPAFKIMLSAVIGDPLTSIGTSVVKAILDL